MSYMFYGCISLTKIDLANSVLNIPYYKDMYVQCRNKGRYDG